MKNIRILLAVLLSLMISSMSFSQDRRTLETKVADLISQFPVNDLKYLDKLMGDMLSLGDEGLQKICNEIIPAGTGDDTKYRFAVESLSRYLTGPGKENERLNWEKLIITFATRKNDPGVSDFFIKQLQLVGGEKTADALKMFISDKENCSSAISALAAIGGKTAEHILAESLKDKSLPCVAAVMNALAGMNSQEAVNEYIMWSGDKNVNTRASAFNALARSGSKEAMNILLKAAKEYSYGWEPAGSVASLMQYAEIQGVKGDIKTSDRICKLLISKCNDRSNLQYKISALELYTRLHGNDAIPLLLKSSSHPDKKYRMAALEISERMKDEEVLKSWMNHYPEASPESASEILNMLGSSGHKDAAPLILTALKSGEGIIRQSAAFASAKLIGKEAAPALLEYLSKYGGEADQQAAVAAFKTIAGKDEVALLSGILTDGPDYAARSAVEIIAWHKDPKWFKEIVALTRSGNSTVKAASFKTLKSVSAPGDLPELLGLLKTENGRNYANEIRDAIAEATSQIPDPEKRSSLILRELNDNNDKTLLIPVLSRTGGHDALSALLAEFKNGDPEMKGLCFETLSSWEDYSASSALFEICASGSTEYQQKSFEGYLRQVRTAPVADDQKLLLLRKIMPYATTPLQKNQIIKDAGNLKTFLSLVFVSGYLDNPETAPEASKSAMRIALPSVTSTTGMYGSLVKEILNKALLKISGPESEYDREMINKYLSAMPAEEGFIPMFNGIDLSGWQGLVEDPVKRAKMSPKELAAKQVEANRKVPQNWSVKDGCIWFNGNGENLCSIKEYGDFEMIVDWKISKKGDSGIYLRGSPQVQIWDTSRVDAGAQVGSGGLYNNQKNLSKPLLVADNPIGDWNTFRILMIGERVSVWFNGVTVVDNVIMENYWDRSIPIFPKGPIELQAHGTDLAFRDIYVREIRKEEFNLTEDEKRDGFVSLFNGKDLDNWVGNKDSYVVEEETIVIRPIQGGGGNLYSEKEYSDFIFRFEFQLTPAANNGLGIRAPLQGDAAYAGMEIQILDHNDPAYARIEPYQAHGSVYGVIPARRDFLKPVGEWNYEEVTANGTRIKVVLNGTVIVDGDIADASKNGTIDHREHPGLLNKTGHIGFLGHGSVLKFRNIRIKELSK